MAQNVKILVCNDNTLLQVNVDGNGVDTKAGDFVAVDVDEPFIILLSWSRQMALNVSLQIWTFVDGKTDAKLSQVGIRGGVTRLSDLLNRSNGDREDFIY